jgi:hypothetical protein
MATTSEKVDAKAGATDLVADCKKETKTVIVFSRILIKA